MHMHSEILLSYFVQSDKIALHYITQHNRHEDVSRFQSFRMIIIGVELPAMA